MRLVIFSFMMLGSLAAQEIAQKPLAPDATGAIYESKTKGGLAFHYRVPEGLKKDTPVNLTFILHGSNLSRGWGFANHNWKSFRPDDVVVCPDGTTENGQGGFNFLQSANDLKRLHELHAEIQSLFTLRATYIYGHSQGSFFALYYAGAYPDEVNGVVAHASGCWIGTAQSKAHHHQAIVFMHGTRDPVVGYGQSVGGFEVYGKAKYPMLRLRSLEGWNHWPAEHNGPVPHTSQQLAWVEGMTTTEPQRMNACLDLLADVKNTGQHDFAGLYSLAARIAKAKTAPDSLKKKASGLLGPVASLARSHAAVLPKPPKNGRLTKMTTGNWWVHLPLFLRRFEDVPEAAKVAKSWAAVLTAQAAAADEHLKDYWSASQKGRVSAAFDAGVAALSEARLTLAATDPEFLTALETWRADAKTHGLTKSAVTLYDALEPAPKEALKTGAEDFHNINKKYR